MTIAQPNILQVFVCRRWQLFSGLSRPTKTISMIIDEADGIIHAYEHSKYFYKEVVQFGWFCSFYIAQWVVLHWFSSILSIFGGFIGHIWGLFQQFCNIFVLFWNFSDLLLALLVPFRTSFDHLHLFKHS